ncbi:DNA-binding transcriptional LysR family regulator [Bradyrhizobium sp. GM0.4]
MNLNRLAYFAAVVDSGSFTRAAERLGITKAVVSQQVAQLERDLGTSLLVRTTRRVHPTEAGRMFHARCVMILREAEDAFDELAQAAAAPTGTLRITAPNDYGTAVVVAVVTAYAARYPHCRVELTLEDQTVDLASGQIDMAIRVGVAGRFQPAGAQDRIVPAMSGRRSRIRGSDRRRARSRRIGDATVHRQHGAARAVAVAVLAR